jgi:hypothetical protein
MHSLSNNYSNTLFLFLNQTCLNLNSFFPTTTNYTLESHDNDRNEQNTDARCFLPSTRDVEKFMVLATLSWIVCKAANLKYKGLLSLAIFDAIDAL